MGRKITKAAAMKYVHAGTVLFDEEGVIEVDGARMNDDVDPRSLLSETDAKAIKENGGVYVKAWVWVSHDDAEEQSEEHSSGYAGCAPGCGACAKGGPDYNTGAVNG